MMQLTQDKLAELKSLAQAATPGPWAVDDQDFVADANGNDIAETLYGNYGNTAAYIAAASPDVVLELIAEIEDKRDALYGVFLLTNKLRDTLSLPEDSELRDVVEAAIKQIERLEKLSELWKHDYEKLAASAFDSRQFVQRLKSGE